MKIPVAQHLVGGKRMVVFGIDSGTVQIVDKRLHHDILARGICGMRKPRHYGVGQMVFEPEAEI